MTNMRRNIKSTKYKPTQRASLVKETSRNSSIYNFNDHKVLNRVIHHLKTLKEKKKSKRLPVQVSCPVENSEIRVDNQVKLKCRQLPNVVQQLRKALMRQDWNEVTALVMILCHPGLKYYTTIILKVCFILLFNHPNSNVELVKNFIRFSTGYVLEEDVNKFLRILFALRKSALAPLESGRYIRKTGDFKVVRDPEFEEL